MEVPQPASKRLFGEKLEMLAAEYLASRGLTLLLKNFHCKMGEIDLVMQEGSTLVFVEVRYRRNLRYGLPIETVDARKQRKLLLCAQYFLSSQHLHDKIPCRFDVIGLCPTHESSATTDHMPLQYHWIRNAFGF